MSKIFEHFTKVDVGMANKEHEKNLNIISNQGNTVKIAIRYDDMPTSILRERENAKKYHVFLRTQSN